MRSADIVQLAQELVHVAGYGCDTVAIATDPLFPDTVIIRMDIPEMQKLSDQEGETIEALRHILQRSVEKHAGAFGGEGVQKYSLDINDYFHNKVEKLKTDAQIVAEQVRQDKQSRALTPMTSYERLIIHGFFADMNDIKTESLGEESERHIVLHYQAI